MGSEQAAAPGTPSTSNTPSTPPTITPANSEATVQPRTRTRTRAPKPSCTAHDFQSGRMVHPGTSPPCLAPSLRASGVFAEDPDEAGGVTMKEGGAQAQTKDPDGAESTPAAKAAGASTCTSRTPVGAKRSPDKPPRKKPPEGMSARAQTGSQMGSVDAHAEEARVTASTARDWHAMLGRAFPVDGGTTPSSSKRPPTHGSGNIAASPGHTHREVVERILSATLLAHPTRAPCAEVSSPPEGNPNATAPWPWTGAPHRGTRPPPSRAGTPQRRTAAWRHPAGRINSSTITETYSPASHHPPTSSLLLFLTSSSHVFLLAQGCGLSSRTLSNIPTRLRRKAANLGPTLRLCTCVPCLTDFLTLST
jgi:hypothetical protein